MGRNKRTRIRVFPYLYRVRFDSSIDAGVLKNEQSNRKSVRWLARNRVSADESHRFLLHFGGGLVCHLDFVPL